MMDATTHKTCTKCGEEKAVESFHKTKGYRGKACRAAVCNQCRQYKRDAAKTGVETRLCERCQNYRPVTAFGSKASTICRSCLLLITHTHSTQDGAKVCSECHKEKPVSDFHHAYPRGGGLQLYRSKCRACDKERRMLRKRLQRERKAVKAGRQTTGARWEKNRIYRPLALLILLGQYRQWREGRFYVSPEPLWHRFLTDEEKELPAEERRRIRYKRDAAYREKVKSHSIERHKKDPSFVRARAHKRRAILRKQHDGTVTAKTIRTLVVKYGKCLYCGEKVNQHTAEMDHLDPVSRGGLHSQFNLAVVCHECNQYKKDKPFDEWIALVREPFKAKAIRYYQKTTGRKVGQGALALEFAS